MDLFDVAIIGGGMSGLGIAEQAARHGLSTVLLERDRCAAKTSDNSLRIMHGGLRYLQKLDVRRIRASARAQFSLLRDFPDLIRPLPCVMPLADHGMQSRLPMLLGGIVYRALTQDLSAKGDVVARVEGPQFVSSHVPVLRSLAVHGVFYWEDALLTDPMALASAVQLSAEKFGAVVKERSPVATVRREDRGFKLALGSPAEGEIAAKVVIDATGPWLGSVGAPSADVLAPRWCRAFNVLFSKQLDPQFAVGIRTQEQRLYFAVPRGTGTALGTGYLPLQGPVDQAGISEAEIEEFINVFLRAFPASELSISDVVGTEIGVLPMRSFAKNGPELYGSEIVTIDKGFVRVLSTKYTTFRTQAEKVLKLIRPWLLAAQALR